MEKYKIYVAGKKLDRAKKIIDLLREHGFEITYDWVTDYSDNNPAQKALDELRGIQNADALIYLWEADQESARYEAGMAMGLGKKIIASGSPDSFFFALPEVHQVGSDDEIFQKLSEIM